MDEEKIKELLMAEFNAIPPREELEKMYTFSERHNKRMEAIFAEVRRRERFERYFLGVRKVAIIILALLGCAVVSLKVVPTVYAYVEAWITENADDRLIFKDKDKEEDSGEKEDLRFELGYVPEGYELVGEEETITGVRIISYKHQEGIALKFIYYGKARKNQLSIDIEGAVFEEEIIEGVKYNVFERMGGKVIVTWERDEYLFRLESVLEKAEVLNIATCVRVAEDK